MYIKTEQKQKNKQNEQKKKKESYNNKGNIQNEEKGF